MNEAKKKIIKKEPKINWEKKAAEYLDGWKRAKADYLNLKKETTQGQQQTILFANVMLLTELLPILDNYSVAIDHIDNKKTDEAAMVGLQHIAKQFDDFLINTGLTKIVTKNQQFNPMFHEAIEQVEREKADSGMIIKEIKPGYLLHGKVIRPAKVTVVK